MFDAIKNYNNDQLKSLLCETRVISDLDFPRYATHSREMASLLELAQDNNMSWTSRFDSVRRGIESEILNRIIADAW